MTAQRASPKVNELPVKRFVNLPWKEEVCRGAKKRVLAGHMPVVPNEAPPIGDARIAEAIVESGPQACRMRRESVNQKQRACHDGNHTRWEPKRASQSACFELSSSP